MRNQDEVLKKQERAVWFERSVPSGLLVALFLALAVLSGAIGLVRHGELELRRIEALQIRTVVPMAKSVIDLHLVCDGRGGAQAFRFRRPDGSVFVIYVQVDTLRDELFDSGNGLQLVAGPVVHR